ncbi:hypothetical protein JW707_01900 [Candidatus Woesearchaeota archaeon]|nr:hypothetical protein [Candidatus Woesearchaeota archaeon]
MNREVIFRKPEYDGDKPNVFQDLWNGYVNTVSVALKLAGQLQTYESATLTDEQMASMIDAENCFRRAIAISKDIDIFLDPSSDKKPIDLRTVVLAQGYESLKTANDTMLS